MSEYSVDCLSSTPPETACPRCGALDPPTLGPGSGPHTPSRRCRRLLRLLDLTRPKRWPHHSEAHTIHTAIMAAFKRLLEEQFS